MLCVQQFQSLSVSLLLKLTDAIIERSNLMFLSHKFRSCLTEQKLFIAFNKRFSQIWRVSVFQNRTLELASPFFASQWKQCSRFPRCTLILRRTWHQAFFLNQLEYALHLLLSPVTMQQVFPVRLAFEKIHGLLDFACTVVKPSFFVVLHLQDPVGHLCTNFS